MKRILILGACAVLATIPAAAGAATARATATAPVAYDAGTAAAHIRAILDRLGDKAALPARQAFAGVTVSPTSSAERYLAIMDEHFSRALGVDCVYCHDAADWSRDAQGRFAAARGMWSMVYHINQDALRKIEGVDRKARVTCATCHRGEVVPARTLD